MESDFQNLPVNITGPSYQDRSRPLSSQETRNFYHEVVESGKNQYVIRSFPGQNLLGTSPAGVDRGGHQMNEVAYRVVGTTLYEVLSDGTHISRGEILGYERCIFADDGENMYIVSHGNIDQYNNITKAVTKIKDPDIVGAKSVTYINSQFAYTFPRLTVFSAAGDGSSASSLNAVGEDSDPDELLRDYAFNQILYRFGKRSIPTWYNSGIGTPPFERIEGQIINTGLGAVHSIANSNDFIYWLGNDFKVYKARSGQEQLISTAAISAEIKSYSYIGDAFGQTFSLDNKIIYVLSFPTAQKTWALIEELGDKGWFQLSAEPTDSDYNISTILDIYGKTLAGNKANGEIYELDFDTYTVGGMAWQRRRALASINGGILGQQGARVEMNRMEIILEQGTGLITGQGEDPRIMVEASYDGGRSWSTGTWLRIGRRGENTLRAEWFNMRSFYDMIVRLTTSDPVAYNLYGATIDIRFAGQ